jgi:AcrR family transcriptional regulator
MPSVKKRAYHSPRRGEQAASTRRGILDAAAELFESRGYTRTTTSAIAKEAGVSEAMVFSAFGSKTGLLKALIGRAVVADDSSRSLSATPAWSEAVKAGDPVRALAAFVEMAAAIQQRTWKLIDLSRTASDADASMAELLAQGAANRRQDCALFITEALGRSLRDGLSSEEAADVLWAHTSADVYRLFVHEAGWDHQHYTDWLRETLTGSLLGVLPTAGRSRQ